MKKLLCLILLLGYAFSVRESDLVKLKTDINALMDRFSDGRKSDYIGFLVRFAGHDAMDFDQNAAEGEQGGADACIDWDDPDNAGMDEIFPTFRALYDTYYNQIMSEADFWHLAANQAISLAFDEAKGQPNAPYDVNALEFKISNQWGRMDRSECDFVRGRLPDAEKSCDENKRVFVDAMGLNWPEIIALMGVHTLGNARASGFEGGWTSGGAEQTIVWDNKYYTEMDIERWSRGQSSAGKNQWVWSRNGNFLMLNTDVCLAFDIGNDATVNSPAEECCAFGPNVRRAPRTQDNFFAQCTDDMQCPMSANFDEFFQYSDLSNADVTNQWYTAYDAVWKKTQALGQAGLMDVCADGDTTCASGCDIWMTPRQACECEQYGGTCGSQDTCTEEYVSTLCGPDCGCCMSAENKATYESGSFNAECSSYRGRECKEVERMDGSCSWDRGARECVPTADAGSALDLDALCPTTRILQSSKKTTQNKLENQMQPSNQFLYFDNIWFWLTIANVFIISFGVCYFKLKKNNNSQNEVEEIDLDYNHM